MHKLQANVFINNLVTAAALQKESNTANSAIGCDNCSAGDPATVRCVICCHFLCDVCKQANRRGNVTKDHKLMSLEEVKSKGPAAMSRPSFCSTHDGKRKKLFCESCEEIICRDCTMVDHRCVSISLQTKVNLI